MIADLQCVVLDCPEPVRLATFYRSILGGTVNRPDRRWALSDDFATLHTASGAVLAFQRATDHQPPRWPDPARPQQSHLDLGVTDLDEAEKQVLALGAELLDPGERGRSWRIYADPAGHPFCLVRHGQGGSEGEQWDLASMPKAEFAFPGPLRERLVAAILDGSKTSTTGLVVDYEHGGEPLPEIGNRSVLVDSDDRPVAVVEVTGVRVVPLGQVDLAHVVDEGEGHTTVAEWRADHERFWHSEGMRAALGDPEFTVDDATPAVLERFRVIADLRTAPARAE